MASAGEVLHSNDSKSLWNYTLSPGWTKAEVSVFRMALMKYGLGKWTDIVRSRCLPGKTVAQLNNQMQRMIGQQSTSEFTGLHVDPELVFKENEKKEGRRKNGCLINMENNPTKEDIDRKRKANQEKFGLSQEEIGKLIIPVLTQDQMSSVVVKSTTQHRATALQAKYDQIRVLQQQLESLMKRIEAIDNGTPLEDDIQVVEQKFPTASKPSTKRKNKSTTNKSKKVKSQEEIDLELARRLQREENAYDLDMEDDDDEFEERPRRRRNRRGRVRYDD